MAGGLRHSYPRVTRETVLGPDGEQRDMLVIDPDMLRQPGGMLRQLAGIGLLDAALGPDPLVTEDGTRRQGLAQWLAGPAVQKGEGEI